MKSTETYARSVLTSSNGVSCSFLNMDIDWRFDMLHFFPYDEYISDEAWKRLSDPTTRWRED